MTDLDDLRERAAHGDAGAMDELLRELQPLILRRCINFLPCRSDAEEAAQDAMVTVATKLGDFSGRGSFLGWVTVIASNCARATYRSLKRRSVEFTPTEMPVQRDPRTTSVIAGTRLDLLDSLEQLEQAHPDWVQPVVLRDLGALGYDEIAAILDRPLGTVKSQIHDARGYLRERLRDALG